MLASNDVQSKLGNLKWYEGMVARCELHGSSCNSFFATYGTQRIQHSNQPDARRHDLESHLPVMFALAPATSAVASGSDGAAARLAMRVGVSFGGGGVGANVGASLGASVGT